MFKIVMDKFSEHVKPIVEFEQADTRGLVFIGSLISFSQRQTTEGTSEYYRTIKFLSCTNTLGAETYANMGVSMIC